MKVSAQNGVFKVKSEGLEDRENLSGLHYFVLQTADGDLLRLRVVRVDHDEEGEIILVLGHPKVH